MTHPQTKPPTEETTCPRCADGTRYFDRGQPEYGSSENHRECATCHTNYTDAEPSSA